MVKIVLFELEHLILLIKLKRYLKNKSTQSINAVRTWKFFEFACSFFFLNDDQFLFSDS